MTDRSYRKLFSLLLYVACLVAAMALVLVPSGQSMQARNEAVLGRAAAPDTPAGTGFTYQGQLKNGGNPANGQYDFQFKLYDALSGGTQAGGTLTVSNQTVTGGLFTVQLDFGANAFGGDARWLEIAVRQNGGGTYTTLSPRQSLTAVPYAMSLATGTSGAAISSTITSGATLIVTNTAGYGIRGVSNSDLTSGIWGSNPSGGTGVYGTGNVGVQGSGTGSGAGVLGSCNNCDGVYGSSNNYGVHGVSSGGTGVFGSGMSSGTGVLGVSDSGFAGYFNGGGAVGALYANNTGTGSGVYAHSYNGNGVYGSSGIGYGVRGDSSATGGYGVFGSASGSGVYGYSQSGTGVTGYSVAGGYGVYGANTNVGVAGQGGTYGVTGNGTSYGVHGSSTNGNGVYGISSNTNGTAAGVKGESNVGNGIGVVGAVTGNGARGVVGYTSNGNAFGVWGQNEAANGWGVFGVDDYSGGRGVVGRATNTNGVGVYGVGSYGTPGNYAGYFLGDIGVYGNCYGCFGPNQIDDPVDPENKYLNHIAVQSDEMMDVYSGNVTTDAKGEAIVTLPEWFEALNKDFRYQLTPVGQFAQAIVASEIKGNRFTIKTDKPNVKVSWQVTGVRNDPYANAHPLQVEKLKSTEEQGKFLHPEVYGQPESKGIYYKERQRADNATAKPQKMKP